MPSTKQRGISPPPWLYYRPGSNLLPFLWVCPPSGFPYVCVSILFFGKTSTPGKLFRRLGQVKNHRKCVRQVHPGQVKNLRKCFRQVHPGQVNKNLQKCVPQVHPGQVKNRRKCVRQVHPGELKNLRKWFRQVHPGQPTF